MLNDLADEVHDIAIKHGFWDNDNVPTKLMLIVSEVAEAMEDHRRSHDPAEELMDVLIRTLDLCAYLKVDVDREIRNKIMINKKREYLHGKRY